MEDARRTTMRPSFSFLDACPETEAAPILREGRVVELEMPPRYAIFATRVRKPSRVATNSLIGESGWIAISFPSDDVALGEFSYYFFP